MKLMVKTLLTATAMAALTSGAMAADLYVPPAAPAMAPAPSTSWDGPYIGATLGYSWGTADSTVSGGSGASASISGFEAGGQIGYNFHVADSIVLGVQGDLNWSNQNAAALSGTSYTMNWNGAVVGRLGVDMGEFLPYVEAGVAFANADWASVGTATHTGWTVGAGVEFMLADNLSANVEARYADYGTSSYGGTNLHLTDTQVRVGLNWHF
jgi:outer membrane immunogenic protein